MNAPDKHISFSSLFELVERGGVEARKRLIELSHLRPKIVLPYAKEVAALLDSTRAPVRNASIEMLAAISKVSPATMAFLIPKLHALLSNKPQNTIANHAIEILHNYAKTSERAARKVIPILRTTIANLGPKSAAKVNQLLKELTK
jgi:hypothetical protein